MKSQFVKPNAVFKGYYARLSREGILKSVLWGAAAGALTAFAAGLVFWLTGMTGFFLTVGVFVGVAAVVSVGLYFIRFKPDAREVARRVDALGLEERLITMLELQGSEDLMAQMQRRDAEAAMNSFGVGRVKFVISMSLITLLCVTGAFGLGMTAVNGLSDMGVIPTGAQLLAEAWRSDPANHISVRYEATLGGSIYGEAEQTVLKGEGETSLVIAVANEGYRFYCWTDGWPYPARTDAGLDEDRVYTAWFLAMDAVPAEEGPDGDGDSSLPPEDGNDADMMEMPAEGGMNLPNYDYVIDWRTHYSDIFDEYYADAMEQLTQDGEISEELRQFLESYFNTLR